MMNSEKNEAQLSATPPPPYQNPEAQQQDNVGVLNRQYFVSLLGIIRMLLIVRA
jgi:hypothetical protein